MASKKQQLKIPKAPPGPPPELPSEARAKSAPSRPSEVPDVPTPQKKVKRSPARPEHPKQATYPFVPWYLLDQFADEVLKDFNSLGKVFTFHQHTELYRRIITHYGEKHKLYKDHYDYGNQEENQSQKGGKARKSTPKNKQRTFYN